MLLSYLQINFSLPKPQEVASRAGPENHFSSTSGTLGCIIVIPCRKEDLEKKVPYQVTFWFLVVCSYFGGRVSLIHK